MSRYEHRSYHALRAQDELKLAAEATDSAVANLHRELAALHRRKMMEIVDEEMPAPAFPPAFDPQI